MLLDLFNVVLSEILGVVSLWDLSAYVEGLELVFDRLPLPGSVLNVVFAFRLTDQFVFLQHLLEKAHEHHLLGVVDVIMVAEWRVALLPCTTCTRLVDLPYFNIFIPVEDFFSFAIHPSMLFVAVFYTTECLLLYLSITRP